MLTKTHDLSWAQKNRMFLTAPYLAGQTMMVTNGKEPPKPVVALYDHIFQNDVVAQMIAGAKEVKHYHTMTGSLDAVRGGEADVTFVNSVIMSYNINIPKYKNLAITPLYGYSADTCIAVSAAADPLLLSILNKGLGNISATQMNSIVAENMKTEHSVDLASVIYDRPVEVVIWVSSILLAFASVLFVMLSNRAKSARIMKTMLYTDSLTGYPNNKALVQDAPSLIGKNPERYALVYMDMRQFKSVNDAFGYDVGDLVLKAISTTLHDFIKKDERFARIYADTFVILLRYTTEREFASRIEALSERLTALPAGEFESANFLFSGGVYHLQKNFGNIDHACDRANYAKSSVKEHFSNSFVFYDDLLHAQIITENHLNRSMTSALESNEFIPYYQPKVNVVTGEVIGAEALVRWLHPEKGCLAPGVFLPFYEKNGFVVKIDFAIFEQVCAHLRKWLDMGIRPVPISVNFSRQHMKDKLIAQRLLEIADRYKVPHHLLEIEITETVELESIEPAVEFVKSLKSLGFSVSIDDYGVGYSSISLLQELPLDVLKLDKKFIENAMLIPKARDIMYHMITAMKNNGIRIICEGIETEAQRDFIVSLNCCFAQGFLYSCPMPPEEFERYLMNATTVASPNHSNLAPVSNFVQRAWAGSEDFLTRVMPGWILGCYVQENYPIFYISPGLLEGLGYSEPEFDVAVGRLYVNCLHPDDLPGTLKLVEENTVRGREMYLQYRLRKRDGGYLWIRDISKRILTDEGKEALLCVCTDITDIVSLQQENDLLIDTIPGGVVELLLGENGIPRVQNATDRFYAIIGHTKEEMDALGNELPLVLHEEDRSGLVEKIREASSSGLNAFQHNLRVQHNDGGTHWVALRGTLHVSYRGSLATVICHNIDAEMRERQNAEVVRAKLELALMLTNHAVFEYDVRTKASSGYSGFEDYGFPSRTPGEAPLNFTMREYIHPEDSPRLEAVLSRIALGEPYASVEVRMLDEKATGISPYIWTRITFSTVFDESGRAMKAVGIVEDIDQEKRFEHAFAQEEQYRSALSECALLAYDINLTKDTVTRITGVSQERFVKAFHNLSKPGNYTELLSTAGATMLAYADRERYLFEMSRENLLNLYRSGTMEKEFEYRRLMPDGQELWVSAFLHVLCDKSSADVMCFVYYRYIHERKEAEKKLMGQATSDPLTGLMNRSSTERLVEDFLAQDVNSGRIHAFMMMDVDNFKHVNDSYGHQFGDAFLINLAKTLRANIEDRDTVSRMGGDEFSVFLKSLPSEDSALAVAQKIKDAVAEIGPSMDASLKSSVSIGIAVAPIHGADFETLYRCADAAMYTAKRERGAQIAMYGKRVR